MSDSENILDQQQVSKVSGGDNGSSTPSNTPPIPQIIHPRPADNPKPNNDNTTKF